MKLPKFDGYNVVYLTKYGSHLYGTNGPNSDMDLKGVFLPTKRQVLLNKVPKTVSFSTNKPAEKNSKDDLDCELYSFGYFLELACSGQTVALEMLFSCFLGMNETQPENVLVHTETWNELALDRQKFLTKSMKAFVGFARSQAVKYSLKGDKLNTAEKVVGTLTYLDKMDKNSRLYEHWDYLKKVFGTNSNVEFTEPEGDELRMMVVCKRGLQESAKVGYALKVVENVVSQYGKRSRQAADHDGADFKAVGHAYRVALELRDLYQTGTLRFPLTESRSGLLKMVKTGQFEMTEVMDKLDFVLYEVDFLAAESVLPEKVNREFFDDLLYKAYEKVVR